MEQEILMTIETQNEKEKPKYDEWEIKDAVRTLVRAEEIKQDKELMAFVAPKLKEQQVAIVNAAKVLYGENNNNKENINESQS